MSLREATIFVAPWQSPERVPCERNAPTTERTPKCVSAHCANIQPHNLAFSVAKYLLSTTLLLYYVQPKLVNVKLANKLQTVNQLHRGGEVLHSENIVATARLGRLPTISNIARREASIRRFSHCNTSAGPLASTSVLRHPFQHASALN